MFQTPDGVRWIAEAAGATIKRLRADNECLRQQVAFLEQQSVATRPSGANCHSGGSAAPLSDDTALPRRPCYVDSAVQTFPLIGVPADTVAVSSPHLSAAAKAVAATAAGIAQHISAVKAALAASRSLRSTDASIALLLSSCMLSPSHPRDLGAVQQPPPQPSAVLPSTNPLLSPDIIHPDFTRSCTPSRSPTPPSPSPPPFQTAPPPPEAQQQNATLDPSATNSSTRLQRSPSPPGRCVLDPSSTAPAPPPPPSVPRGHSTPAGKGSSHPSGSAPPSPAPTPPVARDDAVTEGIGLAEGPMRQQADSQGSSVPSPHRPHRGKVVGLVHAHPSYAVDLAVLGISLEEAVGGPPTPPSQPPMGLDGDTAVVATDVSIPTSALRLRDGAAPLPLPVSAPSSSSSMSSLMPSPPVSSSAPLLGGGGGGGQDHPAPTSPDRNTVLPHGTSALRPCRPVSLSQESRALQSTSVSSGRGQSMEVSAIVAPAGRPHPSRLSDERVGPTASGPSSYYRGGGGSSHGVAASGTVSASPPSILTLHTPEGPVARRPASPLFDGARGSSPVPASHRSAAPRSQTSTYGGASLGGKGFVGSAYVASTTAVPSRVVSFRRLPPNAPVPFLYGSSTVYSNDAVVGAVVPSTFSLSPPPLVEPQQPDASVDMGDELANTLLPSDDGGGVIAGERHRFEVLDHPQVLPWDTSNNFPLYSVPSHEGGESNVSRRRRAVARGPLPGGPDAFHVSRDASSALGSVRHNEGREARREMREHSSSRRHHRRTSSPGRQGSHQPVEVMDLGSGSRLSPSAHPHDRRRSHKRSRSAKHSYPREGSEREHARHLRTHTRPTHHQSSGALDRSHCGAATADVYGSPSIVSTLRHATGGVHATTTSAPRRSRVLVGPLTSLRSATTDIESCDVTVENDVSVPREAHTVWG